MEHIFTMKNLEKFGNSSLTGSDEIQNLVEGSSASGKFIFC